MIVYREGEEWRRMRQSIAPKMMRPKTVEENIDNFNAVSNDAIARFVKLKEACEPDDHIPDLEGELSRFSTESKFTIRSFYNPRRKYFDVQKMPLSSISNHIQILVTCSS